MERRSTIHSAALVERGPSELISTHNTTQHTAHGGTRSQSALFDLGPVSPVACCRHRAAACHPRARTQDTRGKREKENRAGSQHTPRASLLQARLPHRSRFSLKRSSSLRSPPSRPSNAPLLRTSVASTTSSSPFLCPPDVPFPLLSLPFPLPDARPWGGNRWRGRSWPPAGRRRRRPAAPSSRAAPARCGRPRAPCARPRAHSARAPWSSAQQRGTGGVSAGGGRGGQSRSAARRRTLGVKRRRDGEGGSGVRGRG